jgi:hypothetical protein
MPAAPVVVWKKKAEPHGVVLHELLGVEDTWELLEGVPRAATFPADASFTMHPDFPRHLRFTDALLNTDTLLVASLRLKEFREARAVRFIEYLPVTIVDHRGRPAPPPYFIVHPIEPVDCLDLDACEPEWSRVDPESIQRVKRLAIDERRLDERRDLFRPKSFYDVILASRGLAQAIDAAGFTGVRWVELADYR